MGDGVDAACQPADDRDPGPGQPGGDEARRLLAIDRGPAGADDGHGPLVARLDAAPDIEDGRGVKDLAQIGGIGSIVPGEYLDLGPGQLFDFGV